MNENKLTRKALIFRAIQYAALMIFGPVLKPLRGLFSATGGRDTIAVVTGRDISPATITAMAGAAIQALGGIDRFVRRGMTVVIKPNIGWNSPPGRAHNTNPHLVEAVVRMCVQRGARVKVFDRTCNSDRLCYVNSGIRGAARRAGADVSYMNPRKYRTVRVPEGLKQRTLKVYGDVLTADVVINMPIAKHHSLSQLTMAMKNLMGVLGGNRGTYHSDIDKNLVDFVKAIPTHLTILDATRILTNHGPAGGTLADVRETRTIVAGVNPVNVDAYGATLFGKRPSDLGYLRLAAQQGMGEIRTSRMNIIRRSV